MRFFLNSQSSEKPAHLYSLSSADSSEPLLLANSQRRVVESKKGSDQNQGLQLHLSGLLA